MKSSYITVLSIIALSLAKNSKSSGSKNRKYRVGSLFSGILGLDIGLSKGLDNNLEIAFFCESNPDKIRFIKSKYPNTPIYTSVEELLMGDLANDVLNVDMLIGGFPCQDVSSANVITRTGITGPRTSLYFAISELIDRITNNANKPPVIVFENVSGIRTPSGSGRPSPLGVILADMCNKNYVVEYTLVNANNFGSPQMRQRYFGVCYHRKENFFDPESTLRKPFVCSQIDNYFTSAPPISIPKSTGYNITKRFKMLGEAVMPVVAEWVGKQMELSGVMGATSFTKEMEQPVFPMKWEGKVSKLNPMDISSIPIYGGLVWDWNIYYGEQQCLPSYQPILRMPTVTTKSNLLSPSMQKHSTHSKFRRAAGLKTKNQTLSDKGEMINLEFVEWSMSFPKGWTK